MKHEGTYFRAGQNKASTPSDRAPRGPVYGEHGRSHIKRWRQIFAAQQSETEREGREGVTHIAVEENTVIRAWAKGGPSLGSSTCRDPVIAEVPFEPGQKSLCAMDEHTERDA